MRSNIITVALFAATTGIFAQAPAKTFPTPSPQDLPATTFILDASPHLSGCPVGLFASQQASTPALWTIANEDARNFVAGKALSPQGPGLHVDIKAHGTDPIKSITLAVHYQGLGPARAVPTAQNNLPPGTSRDLTKTFTLEATDGAYMHRATNLHIGPAATINTVSILRVDYANGNTWRPSTASACTIEPSRLMLVTSTPQR
jgi:hypothetical protein